MNFLSTFIVYLNVRKIDHSSHASNKNNTLTLVMMSSKHTNLINTHIQSNIKHQNR